MSKPVFGMVFLGGPLQGSCIHHTRLANELVQRGYRVHVWWAMERPRHSPLAPEIRQRWLFSCGRYHPWVPWGILLGFKDGLARMLSRVFPENFWVNLLQRWTFALDVFMEGVLRWLCEGVEKDKGLAKRFAAELDAGCVTHVLTQLSFLSPWVLAARSRMKRPARCLVTFQGYEVCANYARALGCEQRFYEQLREAVVRSDWPAVSLSHRYRLRIAEELHLPKSSITAIPPGIPSPRDINRTQAMEAVSDAFKGFRPDVPLVTYLGRRDAEKGIDLLLYAMSILKRRGLDAQLAVCGPTLHGARYAESCRLVAENLRLPVFWSGYVSDELQAALFAASRAIVYPSIHDEPFGMVPAEAMSYGTPVIVPDHGGIVETIKVGDRTGGLLFRSCDSGDLADRIERILEDAELHERLSESAPHVAAHYSVRNTTDRLLEHMGLHPEASGH